MFPFKKSNETEIKRALAILKRAAAGDCEARLTEISATGDLGELLYSINDLIDRCDSYIRESTACMDRVSHNEYFRKIVETGMQGNFLISSITVNNALESIQSRTDNFVKVTDNFESTVKTIVEAVSDAATELSYSSESLQKVALVGSEKSEIVKTEAESASFDLQSVAAASEYLSSYITEIVEQIKTAVDIAKESSELAEDVAKKVLHLQKAGEQISNAVELIDTIAEQTNLLALNATIEAARAGEAGKGFAVVANEVKALAQETSKATEEINEYVSGIQSAVKETADGITTVSGKISEIDNANSIVSAAVEEQFTATEEIAKNIDKASKGTSEVTVNIKEMAKSVHETGDSSEIVNVAVKDLTHQLSQLKDAMDDYLESARKVT